MSPFFLIFIYFYILFNTKPTSPFILHGDEKLEQYKTTFLQNS